MSILSKENVLTDTESASAGLPVPEAVSETITDRREESMTAVFLSTEFLLGVHDGVAEQYLGRCGAASEKYETYEYHCL